MKVTDLNVALSPMATSTGYGSLAHHVYKSMIYTHGINLDLLNGSIYVQNWDDIEDSMKSFYSKMNSTRIKVHKNCLNLNYPTSCFSLEGQKSTFFTMWESERMPSYLVDCINRQDTCIVPCESNMRTLRESGVQIPLFKVPLGNCQDQYHFLNRNWHISNERPFKFLHIGFSNWRKGGDLAMKAFRKVFPTSQKDVQLIMKISKQYTPPWMIPGMRTQDDRIIIIKEHLSDREMLNLYSEAHCYAGPSRGDAWNLLAFQALATGMPAITTNYCGPEEYQHLTFPLNYKMEYCDKKVLGDDWGYYGEPDLDHLCELMEYAYKNPEACRIKGIEASNEIKKNYTWDQTARKILDVIEMTS